MNLTLHALEPGMGFTHRRCVDPITGRPLLCRLTRRQGERCSVRVVVCAPGRHAPGARIALEPCGTTRDWRALAAPIAELRRGLIATFVLDHASEPIGETAGGDRAAAGPRAIAETRRGLTCLHAALRHPGTWDAQTVRITSVVRGEVNFVGVGLWFGREVTLEPYGMSRRSGRWSLDAAAFRAGVVRLAPPDRPGGRAA